MYQVFSHMIVKADNEKTWGKWDFLLENDADSKIKETGEQRGCLKENVNGKFTCCLNQEGKQQNGTEDSESGIVSNSPCTYICIWMAENKTIVAHSLETNIAYNKG